MFIATEVPARAIASRACSSQYTNRVIDTELVVRVRSTLPNKATQTKNFLSQGFVSQLSFSENGY